MKRFLCLAIGLSISVPAMALDSSLFAPTLPSEPTCETSDTSCIIIVQNQSYDLDEYGAFNFIGIPEDSRCPLDAVCVWAGRVRVELKHDYSSTSEKFEIGLGGDLKTQWIDPQTGLKLSLEQVWPEKILSVPNPEPYRIKLRVEAVDSATADQLADDESPVQ